MVGPKYLCPHLKTYRGKQLCDSCIEQWKTLEKLAGGKVGWKDFVSGNLFSEIGARMLFAFRREDKHA
jgi:hypothetical protein